jgi:hypothetical protein
MTIIARLIIINNYNPIQGLKYKKIICSFHHILQVTSHINKIQLINLMNQLNDLHKLKTIVLSEENHQKLKRLGYTGESFNKVVNRLLEM